MSHKNDFMINGKYKIIFGLSNEFSVCYNEKKPIANNYWQSANPVINKLPIFLTQLCLLIAVTRAFIIILRPLRQPRFLSELLAGILLGPSALGNIDWVANNLTPFEGSLFLETMSNLGVTFYMFLVGLEMDISPLRKIGKMALSVAIAGIMLPLLAGVGLHSMVLQHQRRVHAPEMGAYFWSIALSVTSFPDLARILSSLKLMYTDLGKTALTAAAVSDLSCWSLLVVAVCLINGEKELYVAIPVMCPMRDGLALGVLMNTKGVLALIVLNEGRNMKGFDQQTFTWVMSAILFMTIIIGPIVSYTHKSSRHLKPYRHRNLEKSKPDAPLRVLACVHSTKNLSGLISLMQISNATRKSPITVFGIHLVELTRASAMLIFHDKNKTVDVEDNTNTTREKAEAERIVNAFESFENDNHATAVQTLTAVSPYASMHEDVNNFALDKHSTPNSYLSPLCPRKRCFRVD
ncbi:hypothetical protein V6N13_093405 [Hibiscus sabdariffa]